MELQVLFASLPVADLGHARDWWDRFFGRPCDVDINATEVMWRINDGAWLYVIEDPERAGKGVVAIAVDDLAAAVDELRRRDLSPGEIKPQGDGALKAIVIDPEGNSVQLLEVTTDE